MFVYKHLILLLTKFTFGEKLVKLPLFLFSPDGALLLQTCGFGLLPVSAPGFLHLQDFLASCSRIFLFGYGPG